MPEVIARLKALGEQLGLTVATYGHAGDGNLHANVLFDGPHQRAAVDEAIARMMQIAVEAGGTITGEHGVGLSKRAFLALEQSAEAITVQRQLKELFDPRGLLNPGKIFVP
jgi:glycolate oxidase